MEQVLEWARAAGVRALKSMAQAAVAIIGTATIMGDVSWQTVASAAVLTGVVSLLTSVAGIPEVADGASVAKIAKGARDDRE